MAPILKNNSCSSSKLKNNTITTEILRFMDENVHVRAYIESFGQFWC